MYVGKVFYSVITHQLHKFYNRDTELGFKLKQLPCKQEDPSQHLVGFEEWGYSQRNSLASNQSLRIQ